MPNGWDYLRTRAIKAEREVLDLRAEVVRLQAELNEQKLLTASYATDVSQADAENERLRSGGMIWQVLIGRW